MKTVILAGGRGVRLENETILKPKPMVTIGNLPILMHLIQLYKYYGYKDFLLCLGYKQEIIREYFLNYHLNNSDITINLKSNNIDFLKKCNNDLNISLIDTGIETLTGSRLLKIKDYVYKDDLFFCNYSDGLSDIELDFLLEFHKLHGKVATLLAVQKRGKFGTIELQDNQVTSFNEKPIENDYINGGFFIFSRKFFDYLLEGDLPLTLELLAKENQLMAYKHNGYWGCMDSQNDLKVLEDLWNTNKAPWKVW